MSEHGHLWQEGPELDGQVPPGAIENQWDDLRFSMKLVAPANRRHYHVVVVGSGLAGASVATALGEQGYRVSCFCFQDSPRRAHSVAAQGGINAAKNYRNDGDSIRRLFYDTVKGGDYRSRESNIYRLAQISTEIIDQCVAQGVPFAREYGGYLDNRSFGGVQVSRTFYARGQTGQQLLLGAYQSLTRQIAAGQVEMHVRSEMLDLIVVDGIARGIVVRNLLTGELRAVLGDAVVLATGGYSNVFFLSTNAKGCNATAIWRAYRRGAVFANPCYTQIHPTCIPPSGSHQSKLTLMSESLRNDGRIWVPRRPGDTRSPDAVPEPDRYYFLEEKYPSFGNLVPRDVASRNAKQVVDEGMGVGPQKNGVYLDFSEAMERLGRATIEQRYGNLFDMYHSITGEDPYAVPMRIYPAVHYTMGGLWVDYQLQSNIPGLFVLGEANFSDHGANRLGASALMQGLADGYFIAPYTIGNYLAGSAQAAVTADAPEVTGAIADVRNRLSALLGIQGRRTALSLHRELGQIMWEQCGMARTAESLSTAQTQLQALREAFWNELYVPGDAGSLNQNLEFAGRVADLIELGELLVLDALHREESCGGHFREESQTADGEARRNDAEFSYVAGWTWQGEGAAPMLRREPLAFEAVRLSERSYS